MTKFKVAAVHGIYKKKKNIIIIILRDDNVNNRLHGKFARRFVTKYSDRLREQYCIGEKTEINVILETATVISATTTISRIRFQKEGIRFLTILRDS